MRSNYGITGDIASGKSTVSRYLKTLGFTILDADLIAREVVMPGEKGYLLVKNAFPQAFTGETLDRAKLSQLIYRDPKKREQLNHLLHPLIINAMLQRGEGKTAFFDAPLLFETGLDAFCKTVLYVGLEPDLQLRRLMERDKITEEEARRKMAAFDYPRQRKIEKSVYLDNSGTREELYQQVDEFLQNYGLLKRKDKDQKENNEKR